VNHVNRQSVSAVVTPSFDLDLAEDEGGELDELDPYKGIEFNL
jgi:hypothetical protein